MRSLLPTLSTGLATVLLAVATLPAAAQSGQPPRDLITYACSVTMPSSTQRLVFVEALDKQAARRLADRARVMDSAGKRVPPRSVQECIATEKEKFIDPRAAELLANTPR